MHLVPSHMKKIYLTFLVLITYSQSLLRAQSELWGVTSTGGTGSVGVLFGMPTGSTGISTQYNFTGNPGGGPQYTKLLQASNGKLYGMTNTGGINNVGVLFEYDISTGTYLRKFDFSSALGSNPKGALMQASNGKLYGMTEFGGANDKGVIFEYDISTGNYTKLVDLGGALGENPRGALMQAGNGKLYGLSRLGGSIGAGALFEFDISTGTCTKKVDFTGAGTGTQPFGHLIEAGSKLYGLANASGSGGVGTLFEYDYTTNTFTLKISFTSGVAGTGQNPQGSLMLSSNGKLYGMHAQGGANSAGAIFHYNIGTNTYTKIYNFASGNGSAPRGVLVEGTNGMLYGLGSGGAGGNGMLFSLDTTSFTFTNLQNLTNNSSTVGGAPFGSVIQATNGKLYGLTQNGGITGGGVLFEYDISGATYTKKVDLNSSNGVYPNGHLIQAGNGKLYGLAVAGGTTNSHVGVLFEYDRTTSTYTKKIELTSTNGSLPNNSLVQASNGKLYGLTTAGGTAGLGALFEYDYSTNTYTKKVDLTAANGSVPYGALVQASNGKLYGLTKQGGSSGLGTLFEYDFTANTYSKKVDLTAANGYSAWGSLVQANGKLYGMTQLGGANGQGAIFEYDFSTNTYTKKIDLTTSNGSQPQGSMVLANNGLLYGMTRLGGANGLGVVFEYDPVNNIYTKKIDFTGTNGSQPYGSLTKAANGNLYGITNAGGTSSVGVVFEYVISTNTLTKKIDFNYSNGALPGYTQLLEVCTMPTTPGAITSSTNSLCQSSPATINYSIGSVSNATSYTWTVPTGASIITGSATTSVDVNLSGVAAGTSTYGVAAVNVCGTSGLSVGSVTINTLPVISVNSGSICTGSSFVMIPSGAGAGGTYNFSSGTATVSPVSNTSYFVSGTTSLGCVSSSSATANVTVNALPTISVNSGSICTGQNFVMIPSGAGAGGTYTFSSGAATVSPPSSTSYSVTGTTAAGCTSTASAVSSVNVFATPVISVNSGSICTGQSFVMVPSGAGAGGTYTFSSGSATVSPPSNNSYTVNGTTSAGCTSTVGAVSNINVFATPVISVNSGSICTGQSFVMIPSGAGASGTYTFSSGSATVSPPSNNSYTVNGTTTAGCTSTVGAVANVTVFNTPVISVNSGSICTGQNFVMTPSGAGAGGTYSYNPGGSAVVSPPSSTTYTVNGTTSNGCTSTVGAVANVNVFNTPVISVNSGSICSGNNFTISPSGAGAGGSYTVQGNVFIVSPLSTTSYTVIGKTTAGCTSTTAATSNVTVFATPVISVNSGSICSNNSFTINPTGAGPSGTYAVQGNAFVVSPLSTTSYTVVGTSSAGCTSTAAATSNVTVFTTPTISVNSGSICNGKCFTVTPTGAGVGGSYVISGGGNVVCPTANTSYSVTGTSNAGCPSFNTAVSNVSVAPLPVITATGGVICVGNSFSLNVSGAVNYTYAASSNIITAGGSITVSPSSTTAYTISGASAAGCISGTPAIATVTVNPLPPVSISGSSAICIGDTTTLTANGASTYNWGAITGPTNVVNPSVTSTYSVAGTDVNGCVNSASYTLIVNPLPTVSVLSGAICPGNSFTLTPSGAATYSYSGGSNIVTPAITTTYAVTGISSDGCVSAIPAVATVSVVNILTVTISGNTSVCMGGTLNLTANGASTYSWSTGNLTNILAVSPTTNTTYTVIGSSGTCYDTTSVLITVNQLPNLSISSSSSTMCANENATLTISGAATYSWSTSQTGAIIVVSPLATTMYSATGTDTNNCTNTTSFNQEVNECVGINRYLKNNSGILVYPNPNSGYFVIETSVPTEIKIMNALGELLINQQINEGKNNIDLNDQAKGIYFIQVKEGSHVRTIKMVKQ
jgi:uncharacterized repeat protein (TIGR03803 family)